MQFGRYSSIRKAVKMATTIYASSLSLHNIQELKINDKLDTFAINRPLRALLPSAMIELTFIHLLPLFVIFISLIFFKRSKSRDSSSKPIPGPWKIPIIGNLHQMVGRSQPHCILRDLAKKHGPIMHVKLGEIFAVIVSSPETASDFLKTNELALAQRPSILVTEIISADQPGIISAPYGEYWRDMRKICVTELLGMKSVKAFRPLREEEGWNLIESISSSHKLPINFSKKVQSFATAVISRAAFGKKCKGQEEFVSMVQKLIELSAGFDLPDLFPSVKFLGVLTGIKPAVEKIYQQITEILDVIISEHQIKSKTTSDENDISDVEDLVDVLLKLREKGHELTIRQIKSVILDIFSAGSDTSATTLDWAMSELLRNRRVMEKAKAEVRKSLQGKTKIEEADIQNLEYLKLVIKETLRLHPPAPIIPRETRENFKVRGYEIPMKSKVIVNLWALGRDPEYWTNPDTFEPERFSNSSIDYKGTNFEFIPFGAGRRMCPGISFASTSVELLLSQFLYHFDWKLPNGDKPEDLNMEETLGFTCGRKYDLHLIPILRIPFSHSES